MLSRQRLASSDAAKTPGASSMQNIGTKTTKYWANCEDCFGAITILRASNFEVNCSKEGAIPAPQEL